MRDINGPKQEIEDERCKGCGRLLMHEQSKFCNRCEARIEAEKEDENQ